MPGIPKILGPFPQTIVVDESLGGHQVNAPFPQLGVTDLLHHEIASEAAGCLDGDRPHRCPQSP
jgi:hypothetical protein